MPLAANEPTFDRSFNDIYTELRERIPRYNKQWTNYNDSDPGITLLQLFAWLAEMTLHRMNEVPRKSYLKFAELLGLELQSALPASVRLVFAPKTTEPPALIPARSRYSGRADGTSIIFETTDDLAVIGAQLAAMVVSADGTLTSLPLPSLPTAVPFWPLGRNPAVGDSIWFGFTPPAGNLTPFPDEMRFLALRPVVETNGQPQQIGTQDADLVPPVDLVWEYLQDAADDVWGSLSTIEDDSVALTRDGYIQVEGPQDIQPLVPPAVQSLFSTPLYWLRLRLNQNTYPTGKPPHLDFLLPNAVDAVNLVTETDTPLGQSTGQAGQSFQFTDPPVDVASLQIAVTSASGIEDDDWTARDDFFASGADDKHYVLNPSAGTITFGDGQYGYIPPAGSQIIAKVWRHGGGIAGNQVLAGAVTTMVSQLQGISNVINPRSAAGGANEEALDHFIQWAPYYLHSSNRVAVTAADFQSQALRIGGVKKAKVLGGRHPDYPDVTVPGALTVFVVPDSDAMPPVPSAELIRSVCKALDGMRLITTEVFVSGPQFIKVRIEARILAAPNASLDKVELDALGRLNAYLSPFQRDFGEAVSAAAIYAQLFGPNVHSVEDLFIYVNDQQHDIGTPVSVAAGALVYPGDHLIVVRPDVA